MTRLEDLTKGAQVKGILPNEIITVVDVKWHGSSVVELTYKDITGSPRNELIYREKEPSLEVVSKTQSWCFDSDGLLFKLAAEAHRIRLAYLFDPLLAVHISQITPLPHQITACYDKMLPRQPLRFLLADDPGAGKTIMAGLFIRELYIRGDVKRCLIVSPGNLVEQWQDELSQKFHLNFDILTNDKVETAVSGNWFAETPLVICRLDKLSRDESLHDKLSMTDWDLIVCDEAHKMSASFFGGEIKYTKRYRLGQLLGRLTRHFLLMTATPHNGKEEDFQLFMALLDGDRFEGRFRDGVHTVDTADLMRRIVKEKLVKFDGTPLFPERRAYTVKYKLSDVEALLYTKVTEYVRNEFNRADNLESEGQKGTIGFALTILQRRLASSPEAISQSLRRRRERLEKRLREEEILKRGGAIFNEGLPSMSEDDIEDIDDAPEAEIEDAEEKIVDQATAARTIGELKAEIAILAELEKLAQQVVRSGKDKKWEELSRLLQDNPEMQDKSGHRRKLVIFTEHRDTLSYLTTKIRTLLGRQDAVVNIHGGLGREERAKAKELFINDKGVEILVATDAAGEGINLQRAHLMVNYDLPWNPNRLEQRFGRIHRIGQTEVCHLWNLVADETREGDVFAKLLEKLEIERSALEGDVFDILGQVFQGTELRHLLIEAIRYGDQPDVRAKLHQKIEANLDRDRLKKLLEERALTHDIMSMSDIQKIREAMERAEARKLQPHFIAGFFLEALKRLGGTSRERESNRYEVTHVPISIRNRDRLLGTRETVLSRYERITFEKDLVSVDGKPLASFVCPGHPLLDATIDLVLEQYRNLMKHGTILIDRQNTDIEPRILFMLEHSIQDARQDKSSNRRIVSREMHFIEMHRTEGMRSAGYAPYLDYEPASDEERNAILAELSGDWLSKDFEAEVISYAIENLVPRHFNELKERKEELIRKTMAAVKDRLTKEINYWDNRCNELKLQELAGKVNAKINSGKARQRADELEGRLKKRMEELEQERHLSPLPPVVVGGSLVIPAGLLNQIKGEKPADDQSAVDKKRVEELAMKSVMAYENKLGNEPLDVCSENRGYDIESRDARTGSLRFIEVKGRDKRQDVITITKNEILTGLNKPEDFILALVLVEGDSAELYYCTKPFTQEPEFGATSVNFKVAYLLGKSERIDSYLYSS